MRSYEEGYADGVNDAVQQMTLQLTFQVDQLDARQEEIDARLELLEDFAPRCTLCGSTNLRCHGWEYTPKRRKRYRLWQCLDCPLGWMKDREERTPKEEWLPAGG